MSSDHRPADPALDRYGPKPTDNALPIERRTWATSSIIAVGIALLIGVGLIGYGIMRLGESTASIEQIEGAVGPGEQLVPDSE